MENYAANLSMMKRCRLYIDENLHDKKLLQGPALAQHFDCSYTNFRRIFLAIGGYTVHEYVQTRRVQKAAMCLRKGQSMEEAKASSGYGSDVGFRKAFINVYGMSPAVFAEDRGEGLMREPEIMTREGFYVVGYKLPAPDEIKLEECGAYWIAQDYPSVSAREYGRIGGGAEMIGVFVRDGERNLYLHGPGVPKVRYVPEHMMAYEVSGGRFAVFRIDRPPDRSLPPNEKGPFGTCTVPDNSRLCEDFRVTWYYALHQWLPDSDWLYDRDRVAYEYYLDDDQLICIPVRPKIEY